MVALVAEMVVGEEKEVTAVRCVRSRLYARAGDSTASGGRGRFSLFFFFLSFLSGFSSARGWPTDGERCAGAEFACGVRVPARKRAAVR